MRYIGIIIFFMSIGCSSEPVSNRKDIVAKESADYGKVSLPATKVGRNKKQVVILANNDGAETADFILPYSVLKQSGAVDVITVAREKGGVNLMPALKIETDATIEEYDKETPNGADIIIVPAMHDSESAKSIQWLQAQAKKGAFIVAICEGAKVIAYAGLLEGKTATTHWYALSSVEKHFKNTRWLRNRRYVVDGNVMTTAGVTASIPATLAILEAIIGTEPTQRIGMQFGTNEWGTIHNAEEFQFRWREYSLAIGNILAFWRNETIGIYAKEGVDEASLALAADAWSRTYRSKFVTYKSEGSFISKRGLKFVTEKDGSPTIDYKLMQSAATDELNFALANIQNRYGEDTARFVRFQLEYPVKR